MYHLCRQVHVVALHLKIFNAQPMISTIHDNNEPVSISFIQFLHV
jgi:hypothetical protein